MVDKISAMKFDMMATGNGRRESFRHKPIVRMTNTYIAPGQRRPRAILRDTAVRRFRQSDGRRAGQHGHRRFRFRGHRRLSDRERKAGRSRSEARPSSETARKFFRSSTGSETISDLPRALAARTDRARPSRMRSRLIRIPELTVGGEVPMTDYWKTS